MHGGQPADLCTSSDALRQTVRIAGRDLSVAQAGMGRELVLIHASPGCLEDWQPLGRALPAGFRTTAFDRLGHGRSDDHDAPSLASHARTVGALIDALQLRDVIVVGHAYGGAIALALALTAPPAVAAYVILDTAAYEPPAPPELALRMLATRGVGGALAAALAGGRAKKRIEAALRAQFEGCAPPTDVLARRARTFAGPKSLRAMAREQCGYAHELAALAPRYGEIARPVWILAQSDDPLRRDSAERLHRAIAGSVLRLVPNSGHYLQFEQPATVVAAICGAASAHAPGLPLDA